MGTQRLITGALLAVSLSPFALSAQNDCTHKRVFSGEEDACFDAAPNPSPTVMAAILRTKDGREAYDDLDTQEQKDVKKFFKGLTVHLHSRAQQDMIVRGDFPMSGGDNTWFWIVISAIGHPLALYVQGNAVTILKTHHQGYADIQTDWAAGSHRATRIFRFDSGQYKLFKESYEDLPPELTPVPYKAPGGFVLISWLVAFLRVLVPISHESGAST